MATLAGFRLDGCYCMSMEEKNFPGSLVVLAVLDPSKRNAGFGAALRERELRV